MTLDKIKKGQRIQIQKVADPKLRDQIIRMGIYEGAKVICAERLGKGPIVIKNRMQEIAIGRGIAEKISIEVI
jgi:Fe2+ transport system protein FeoA